MATHTEAAAGSGFDHEVHARLLQRFEHLRTAALDNGAAGDPAAPWLLLEAAHVVGQTRLGPHLQTHALMLALAWRTHDGREIAGQLLRLLLVPLGHLSGRLPMGNAGRANISAFQPMPVRPDIAELIALARREAWR